MSRELVIAHLSDLHLSRYGERVTAGSLLKGRLPRPGLLTKVEWRDLHDQGGWKIQAWSTVRRKVIHGGSLGVRLIDPDGVRHDRALLPPGRGQGRRVEEAVEQMRLLARVRATASLATLCRNGIGGEELESLLAIDPGNTNLRFIQALKSLRALSPDMVVVTGDITDDGWGYELVTCALSDYIVADRFFAVAGNHDLSPVPPGSRHNMPLVEKATRWAAFRSAARLDAEGAGASSMRHDDVLFLGLNSSIVPERIPWSGLGKVGHEQLTVAARLVHKADRARAKLCLVHHHVAHLRLGPISRAQPGQFAMKLRDARQVVQFLGESRFDAVLNGHRHHGYHLREGSLPHVVSSPSTTLGCRSSGARYYWVLRVVGSKVRVERHHIVDDGVEEDVV